MQCNDSPPPPPTNRVIGEIRLLHAHMGGSNSVGYNSGCRFRRKSPSRSLPLHDKGTRHDSFAYVESAEERLACTHLMGSKSKSQGDDFQSTNPQAMRIAKYIQACVRWNGDHNYMYLKVVDLKGTSTNVTFDSGVPLPFIYYRCVPRLNKK